MKTKSVYFKYFKQKGKQKIAILWHDLRGTTGKKPLTQEPGMPQAALDNVCKAITTVFKAPSFSNNYLQKT